MNPTKTRDPRPETQKLVALSIRQPWAWLIAHGYKSVENREWPTRFRGRFLIHAGKTLTKADYESCVIFCSGISTPIGRDFDPFPTMESLREQRGGIVGAADLMDCVTQSDSEWFCGPYGFVLANQTVLPFLPCKVMLGFFKTPLP